MKGSMSHPTNRMTVLKSLTAVPTIRNQLVGTSGMAMESAIARLNAAKPGKGINRINEDAYVHLSTNVSKIQILP